jgi:hypothetical protein
MTDTKGNRRVTQRHFAFKQCETRGTNAYVADKEKGETTSANWELLMPGDTSGL